MNPSKKRKPFWKKLVIGIVCAITLIAATGSAISHLRYHRSMVASIMTIVMRMTKNNASYEEELARFEAMVNAGEEQYALPASVRFDAPWTEEDVNGMKTYFMNRDTKSDLTILFIHGEGCVSQPSAQHWQYLNKFVKRLDAEVIAPIYPLAPYHTYEETYEKLIDLYTAWIRNHENRTLMIMGDSAGGGLAIGLIQRLNARGIDTPSKAVLISPWVDFTLENPDIANYEKADAILAVGPLKAAAQVWAGDTDVSDGKISVTNGDLSQFPETMIIQGTADIFYPDVMAFAWKLEAKGRRVQTLIGKNLCHVYPIMPMPEAKAAIDAICAFILSE